MQLSGGPRKLLLLEDQGLTIGRLLAGVSTVTVTFPSGTTVPASITPSTVFLDGVSVSTVTTASRAPWNDLGSTCSHGSLPWALPNR